jgi:hypothetical protein
LSLQTKRTLRIFVSNTAYNQPWQTQANTDGVAAALDGSAKPEINAETGEGIPGWTLRVEGRLLDVRGSVRYRFWLHYQAEHFFYGVQTGNNRIDRTTKKRFSNCIKSLIVDMDNREPQNFSEPNIVEVSLTDRRVQSRLVEKPTPIRTRTRTRSGTRMRTLRRTTSTALRSVVAATSPSAFESASIWISIPIDSRWHRPWQRSSASRKRAGLE